MFYQIIAEMHLRKYLTRKGDRIFQKSTQTFEDASPEFPLNQSVMSVFLKYPGDIFPE